jgi:hypothetical protein
VFGLEGQGDWADFSGSNATPTGGPAFLVLRDANEDIANAVADAAQMAVN